MAAQGFEEGVDWDFYYYLDAWKYFAPMCKYEEAKCDEELDAWPAEDYLVYKSGGKKERVSKKKYFENDNFLPNPELSVDVDYEEISLWYAFWDAVKFFANRGGIRYFRVYTTDDVIFKHPNLQKGKWHLGKNLPEYTGLYDLSLECYCDTPRCLLNLFTPEQNNMKIFALREFMEFKLAHQEGLKWNKPEPFFKALFKWGLNTVEREIEMFKGYFYPTPASYESVHSLNLGVGCDNSFLGGVNSSLPNHVF